MKHQVDFVRHRRIVFTGSAMPLLEAEQESGVGRWHAIRLTTLSFYEYLQLKKLALPKLPVVSSLTELFDHSPGQLLAIQETAEPYVGHFHEYLVRGGFPQTDQVESITQAQRLLREDIIDKVLKRDMTALFGVRGILDLEQTFLYLCTHDGGLLDMPTLCGNLEVKRPTAQHFIEQLKGLFELCQDKRVDRSYVVTKSLNDFGPLNSADIPLNKIMRIPAPLLCYWMGEAETHSS